jgi:hypothetical protein
MTETFEELALWYRDNQDPFPSRIVSRKRTSADGRPDWTNEFFAWLTAPESINVYEETRRNKIIRQVEYAYPMRRAIAIAQRMTRHKMLPPYGETLLTFTRCQYSVEALASAFASAYPVMGEPRIARAHLKHALRRAHAAYRFI